MENIRQQFNRPIVVIILALLGGIILALVIGYWLWPVQWTNSSYEQLRPDLQDDVMRGAINSYSLDGDVNLANFRYSQFGESGPTVLAGVVASPGVLNPADIQAFAVAVQAEPPAPPAETAPRSTVVTVLIVIIALLAVGFVLVLGVLLILRLRGKEGPEETFVAGEGLIPTPVEPQEEMAEEMPHEPEQEDWSMPPATAGAAGAVGAAYILDDSEQPEDLTTEDYPFEPEFAEEVAETPAELHPMDSQKMSYDMDYIEGVGPVYAEKLKAVGIDTPKDLLERGSTPKGRQEIADATGISEKLVLKWVNHVDLYRIKGIGSEYADLLEIAGVDTVVELATRNPANLYQRLVSINIEKRLVRKVPFPSQVEEWIEQAKQLPRAVSY